jgi:hypothetical protein
VKIAKEIKLNEAIIKVKEDVPQEVQHMEILQQTLEANYKLATTLQKIVKGEKNWYMFSYPAMEILKQNGLTEPMLHYFVAEHIFDELSLGDVILLLKQHEVNPIFNTSTLFKYIKTYINKQILTGRRDIKGFLWKNQGKLVVLVKDKNDNTQWNIAESEDIKDLKERMDEKKTHILSNINNLMGFMNNFKAENYVVFKTKNVTNARDLGARCDQQSNKNKAIEILNSIIGENIYSTQVDIPQKSICILQEFYLRHFEKTLKNKKHWFLSPPEAVLTDIEKFTTVIKTKKKGKV